MSSNVVGQTSGQWVKPKKSATGLSLVSAPRKGLPACVTTGSGKRKSACATAQKLMTSGIVKERQRHMRSVSNIPQKIRRYSASAEQGRPEPDSLNFTASAAEPTPQTSASFPT
jgi:hypothetical protein